MSGQNPPHYPSHSIHDQQTFGSASGIGQQNQIGQQAHATAAHAAPAQAHQQTQQLPENFVHGIQRILNQLVHHIQGLDQRVRRLEQIETQRSGASSQHVSPAPASSTPLPSAAAGPPLTPTGMALLTQMLGIPTVSRPPSQMSQQIPASLQQPAMPLTQSPINFGDLSSYMVIPPPTPPPQIPLVAQQQQPNQVPTTTQSMLMNTLLGMGQVPFWQQSIATAAVPPAAKPKTPQPQTLASASLRPSQTSNQDLHNIRVEIDVSEHKVIRWNSLSTVSKLYIGRQRYRLRISVQRDQQDAQTGTSTDQLLDYLINNMKIRLDQRKPPEQLWTTVDYVLNRITKSRGPAFIWNAEPQTKNHQSFCGTFQMIASSHMLGGVNFRLVFSAPLEQAAEDGGAASAAAVSALPQDDIILFVSGEFTTKKKGETSPVSPVSSSAVSAASAQAHEEEDDDEESSSSSSSGEEENEAQEQDDGSHETDQQQPSQPKRRKVR